jgi:hypothetical protein
MPAENELDDPLSTDPQILKAEIRRTLDEMVALGLLEVRIDEHGVRRYCLTVWGRARLLRDVDWLQ